MMEFLNWRDASGVLGIVAMALVGIVWKSNDKKHEDRRQGEIKLHERIQDHEKQDSERFERVMTKMAENHEVLLNHVIDLKDRK